VLALGHLGAAKEIGLESQSFWKSFIFVSCRSVLKWRKKKKGRKETEKDRKKVRNELKERRPGNSCQLMRQ